LFNSAVQLATEVSYDGEKQPLPLSAAAILENCTQAQSMIQFTLPGEIIVNWYFYPCETEIEMDITPNEIKNPETLDALLDFMRKIGGILGKDVLLTMEGASQIWIYAYRASSGNMEFCHTKPWWVEDSGWKTYTIFGPQR
jgi:hypothetical protein